MATEPWGGPDSLSAPSVAGAAAVPDVDEVEGASEPAGRERRRKGQRKDNAQQGHVSCHACTGNFLSLPVLDRHHVSTDSYR